jgi:hypothetical protein
MAELIHVHMARVADAKGQAYVARTFGEERSDGTWAGWIEFAPAGNVGQNLRTDQETSQPGRAALEYWAAGLEPIFLDGALERARRHSARNDSYQPAAADTSERPHR